METIVLIKRRFWWTWLYKPTGLIVEKRGFAFTRTGALTKAARFHARNTKEPKRETFVLGPYGWEQPLTRGETRE